MVNPKVNPKVPPRGSHAAAAMLDMQPIKLQGRDRPAVRFEVLIDDREHRVLELKDAEREEGAIDREVRRLRSHSTDAGHCRSRHALARSPSSILPLSSMPAHLPFQHTDQGAPKRLLRVEGDALIIICLGVIAKGGDTLQLRLEDGVSHGVHGLISRIVRQETRHVLAAESRLRCPVDACVGGSGHEEGHGWGAMKACCASRSMAA